MVIQNSDLDTNEEKEIELPACQTNLAQEPLSHSAEISVTDVEQNWNQTLEDINDDMNERGEYQK